MCFLKHDPDNMGTKAGQRCLFRLIQALAHYGNRAVGGAIQSAD